MADNCSSQQNPANTGNPRTAGSGCSSISSLANHGDDPNPIDVNSMNEQKLEYVALVAAYSKEMLEYFKNSSSKGESLSVELTTTFPEHSIHAITASYIFCGMD